MAHQAGGPGPIAPRPRVADARWDLVLRVAESRCFQRSARLRDFLFYVASRALDEPGVAIHEQEIAIHVFGRSPDATAGEDTIVRVHASQLRKRLQEYFASEGAQENTLIEIPRGNYAPVFKERENAPVSRRRWPRALTPFVLSGVVAGLAIVCGWLMLENRDLRRASRGDSSAGPAVERFWSRFTRADRRLDIVLADSNLSLMEDLLQRPFGLDEYLNRSYFSKIEALSNPDLRNGARNIMMRQHTSLADAALLRKVLRLTGDSDRTNLIFSRDFHARYLKTDDVILFGSRRSNPWVELVEDQMNFRFGFDENDRAAFIVNRQSRAGEQGVYRAVPRSGMDAASYCVIACLPNLSRTGSILMIAGTEMEGTEAGGEFLTSEHWLQNLSRSMQAAPHEPFPYFEVLLKNVKMGGTSPHFSVVAWRRVKD
ncbi:MAG: hypothetical protein LLG20_13565 [Acidobacteriales bacterium]|nr:hypothetical protein [Terriglobales bacterium]